VRDVNANIVVNVNTSEALAQLKALQREIATLHSSISKSSAASVAAQKNLQTNLLNSINATGQFSAQMGVIRTSTESFTHALENNKLSMREYFRYAGASTKSFGRLFKSEFDTIGKVAEDRVRKLQTQYISMGRDAKGAMQAVSITPNTLNLKDFSTQAMIAAQKQALFGQLLKQGSTNMLNFGKNTQWAGRQLMVGFTVPLVYFMSAASKAFIDLEKEAVKFKRVYGDMFTTTADVTKALQDVQNIANGFVKYGVAAKDTMAIAADIAAMGKTGVDLTNQLTQAVKLSVLGNIDQQQALQTTISIQNAFGISTDQLASKIDFLNAVENQTVLNIEDLTVAIPKVAPVIKQLGGTVEDAAFFMTAMKEGGIEAAQGANALKSAMGSIINPTKSASEFLAGFGVNIKGIVDANAGNLRATITGVAQALDTLDPLNRSRAIEMMFGKFQFARISTLFKNITKDGSQANKVLELTQNSVEELAILSQREMKTVQDAVGTNFKASIEKLKITIAPIGKTFLQAITPLAKALGDIFEKFNNLSDGTKKFIVTVVSLGGILGPLALMTFGLVANGAANIIKLFLIMRNGFLRLGGESRNLGQQLTYFNEEQLQGVTVAASLNQAHTQLTQKFELESVAVNSLRTAYIAAAAAARGFAIANPGMMTSKVPGKFAVGTTSVPGPAGAGDIIPSLLSPGEAVIPAKVAQDPTNKPLISALVNGTVKKYSIGTANAGEQYSHVGGSKMQPIDTLLALPNISELDKAKLTVYKDFLSANGYSTEVSTRHNLAFSFPGELNRALAGSGISFEEFQKAWTNGGAGKWISSNIPASEAKLIDDEILKKIQSGKHTAITDKIVEQAFLDLPAKIKAIPTYQTMSQLYSTLGEYTISRGLPSTPKGIIEKLNMAGKDGIAAERLGKYPVVEINNATVLTEGPGKGLTIKQAMRAGKWRPPNYQHTIITRGDRLDQNSGIYIADSDGIPRSVGRGGDGQRNPIGQRPKPLKIPKISNPVIGADPIPVGEFEYTSQSLSRPGGYSYKEANHLSGVYETSDGRKVFAKPVRDLLSARAEQRATQIARDVHGLKAPTQTLRSMLDPKTGKPVLFLESPYDANFVEMNGKFTKGQYFKQLVALALRGDIDLQKSNLSGDKVADVGAAGVFDRASGERELSKDMRSMKDTARIALMGAKAKGANYDFAKSTMDIPFSKGMDRDKYHALIINEIEKTLPKLKKTVANFENLSPQELTANQNMIKRLEAGLNENWREIYDTHVQVRPKEDLKELDKSLRSKSKTPTARGEVVAVNLKEFIKHIDKNGKISYEAITGQNAELLPKSIKSTQGAADTHAVFLPKGSEIVKLKGGASKKVNPIRIPGHADAPTFSNPDLSNPGSGAQQNYNRALTSGATAIEGQTQQTIKTAKATSQFGNKMMGGVSFASGLVFAMSFLHGKVGEFAQKIVPIAIILPLVLQAMTMMKGTLLKSSAELATLSGPAKWMAMAKGPMLLAVVAITAFTLAIKSINDAANKAREAVLNVAKNTGTTSDSLEKLGIFANKASAAEQLRYRQEQNKKPLGIAAGKTSYGEAFVKTQNNAEFIASIKENLSTNGVTKTIQDLQRQLSTAVVSGVLNQQQAKSIALEMGTALGNQSIGINVSAKLDELFGPNGENLLDPNASINLKVKLLQEANSQIKKPGDLKLGPVGKIDSKLGLLGSIAAGATGGYATGSVVGGIGGMVTGGPLGALAGVMAGGPIGGLIGAISGGVMGMKAMASQGKLVAAWSAANVASQTQALTIANEMEASLQLQYEKEMATAKLAGDTAKQRKLTKQYTQDLLALEEQRNKIGKSVLRSYDQAQGNTERQMLKSAKSAAEAKNKENPQYALAQELLKSTSGRREYALTVSMASGDLTPEQVVQIMQTFGKNKKDLNAFVNLLPKIGGAGQSKAADILSAFVSKDGTINEKAQSEFIIQLTNTKNSKEANDLMNFYDVLSKNAGVLDVGVIVNYYLNNPEAKKTLDGILKKIDKNDGKLNIDVATKILPVEYMNAVDKAYFNSLAQNEKKVYLQEIAQIMSIDVQTLLNENDDFGKWGVSKGYLVKGKGGLKVAPNAPLLSTIKEEYADAIGQKGTNANKSSAVKSSTDGSTSSSGVTKTDPYAFLQGAIDSVRKFKNLSIDAITPLNALKQVMSGKIKLDAFNGLAEKLAAVKKVGIKGGAGMSEGFMDALLGLDKATFDKLNKKIYTIKNGIITLTAQGKAANKLFDAQALGESAGALQKLARETNEQSKAYRMLIASGLDSATAMKISSDAALASQIANKRLTLTSKEWKQYAASIKAAKAAEKEASVTNLMDRLRQEVNATNDKKTATDKLTAAGISLARAEEVASDQAAAFAIANGKIKPEDWPVLLDLIKKTGSAIGGATNALDEFLNKMHADTKLKMDFAPTLLQLKEMGADSQLIQDILGNPELMQSILDGLAKASNKGEFLKQVLDEATRNRTVNIDINMIADPKTEINNQINDLTSAIDSQISVIDAQITVVHDQFDPLIAGAQASVDAAQASIDAINAMYDTQINAIQSTIDAQQHAIAQMFDAPIAAFQNDIAALQKQMADTIDKPVQALNDKISAIQHQIDIQFTRPLAALSDESNILSNNLTILNHQEQAINDKYDKQIAALEEVNKINQDISNQKKSQLSIADALSKGDISAAAKAIEDMRAQEAASAGQSAVDAMNAARKGELGGLTVNGMTKVQIEQRQYEIQQQQFKLQQQQAVLDKEIQGYQDQIYQIELGRKAIQDQITAIEEKIAVLEEQKKAALAVIAQEEEQIYQFKQQQTAELNAANAELKKKQDALVAIQKQMEDQLKPLEDQKTKWEEIKHKLELQQAELDKIPTTLEEAKTKAGDLATKIANIGTAAKNAAAEIAAMVAAIGAAQAAQAAAAAALAASQNTGNGPDALYDQKLAADAAAALNKLTSGQTLTAAEYALLGMTPPTSGPSVSLGVGGDQGNPLVGTRLVPGTGIYNGNVFVPPQYYASGGEVAGMFKKKGTDTVPAMLTPGEYVINRHSTKKFRPMLDKINKGKHPHGEHEGRGDGGKPGDNGKPGTGTSTRTGSTRGGEARSYDPGFKGTTGDLNAPSFANGTVGDGMTSNNGNNSNATGYQNGTGGNTGTSGSGGGAQSSAQQASAQKDLLAIEKQIETVLKAIAVLEEQITNAMSMQLQIEQQVQAIYTKLPQLAIQLIAQLKLEKDFATSILELLNKEYKVFEQILTDEILINAQNNIHKEFLLYALDKVTGYPKIFSWLDQMWLKIKNNINPELLFSIENFKQLIIKNEILYKAIAKELIDAIDKANTALQKVLGTMSGIAAKAQAALAAIMALNTTVVTTHIINTIYTTSGTPPGVATGGSVTNASNNGGGIPKLFSSTGGIVPKYLSVGGNSSTFQPVGTDTIPAMLTPGEFVINANATKNNIDLLQRINSGSTIDTASINNFKRSAKMPTFTKPTSKVQSLSAPRYSSSNLPRQASSEMNTAVAKTPTSISDNSAVYNYSVNVNVNGTEAGNPNDIANAVMRKIREVESQQIRKQVSR